MEKKKELKEQGFSHLDIFKLELDFTGKKIKIFGSTLHLRQVD